MGENDIRSYLSDARDKGWSEQALVQKATAMAKTLHTAALGRSHAEERHLLSALSRLAGKKEERDFVVTLCRQTLFERQADRAMENLRSIVSDYGGVPTFFSSAGRLRIKAALMAPRGMQEAALREVKRVFRTTLGGVVMNRGEEKPGHRAAMLKKNGMQLMMQPLGWSVCGEKAATAYRQMLLHIPREEPGAGLVVEAEKLYPGCDAAAPEDSIRRLGERLGEVATTAGAMGSRVLVRSSRSDLQAIVLAAVRNVADSFSVPGERHLLEVELAGHLPASRALLRELSEWAESCARTGSAPFRVHLVAESHREEDDVCAEIYGDGAATYAPGDETAAGYAQLIRAAMECSPKAISPVVHTQNPVYACYAMLSWARSGREGNAPLAFDYGTGSYLGRVAGMPGGDIELIAPWIAGESGERLFEQYLMRVIDELVQGGKDGYLQQAFSSSTDAVDWDAMARPLRVAESIHSTAAGGAMETTSRERRTGNLGNLLVRAEVESYYAAATEEQERVVEPLPLVPGGVRMESPLTCIRRSLIAPGVEIYRYRGADYNAVDETLRMAKKAAGEEGSAVDLSGRARTLRKVATELRVESAKWVALLVRDAGCTIRDAVCELRDARAALLNAGDRAMEWEELKDGAETESAGVVVVSCGEAHPLSDAAGAIATAWMAGGVIIYKPAACTTLLGTRFAELLNKMGIGVMCLPCGGEEIAQRLMSDERVDLVLCRGTVEQARRRASLAAGSSVLCGPEHGPSVYLAESCNWQKVVPELVQAALRRSGQSPDAPHLVFLHASLYDNPAVRAMLEDAVALPQAQPTHLQSARLGPLAAPFTEAQRRLLDEPPGGEEDWWALPRAADCNSLLRSVGLCSRAGMHREIPAHGQKLPIIGLVRVESCDEAAGLQRRLACGSRAVIYSQDAEEVAHWEEMADCRWVAVNCFPTFRPGALPQPAWNTGLRGAVGTLLGTTDTSVAFNRWREERRPGMRSARRQLSFDPKDILPSLSGSDDVMRLSAAADSISYWWEKLFGEGETLSSADGMQAQLRYFPVRELLRVEKEMSDVDAAVLLMVAMQARSVPEISVAKARPWLQTFADRWGASLHVEKREDYEARFPELGQYGVLVRDPAATLQTIRCAAIHGVRLITAPVLANARIEFLYHMEQRVRITPKSASLR